MAQLHAPSPQRSFPMQRRPSFNWKAARQRVHLEHFILHRPVLSSVVVCLPIMALGFALGLVLQ